MSTTQTPTNTDEMNRKLHEAAVGEHELHCPNCSIPAYDQNLEAAFELVEWMRQSGKWCCIKIYSDHHYIWAVLLIPAERRGDVDYKHKPVVKVTDESLPKAIALACYRALGLQENA